MRLLWSFFWMSQSHMNYRCIMGKPRAARHIWAVLECHQVLSWLSETHMFYKRKQLSEQLQHTWFRSTILSSTSVLRRVYLGVVLGMLRLLLDVRNSYELQHKTLFWATPAYLIQIYYSHRFVPSIGRRDIDHSMRLILWNGTTFEVSYMDWAFMLLTLCGHRSFHAVQSHRVQAGVERYVNK